jgi:hypothetical protein
MPAVNGLPAADREPVACQDERGVANLIIRKAAGTTRISSALLRHGPGTLMLLLAVAGFVRDIRFATYLPRDDAPSIIARFSRLKAELPTRGTGCYAPHPRNSRELRPFGLAQYALTPLILKLEDGDCPWTIGPDFSLKVR